MKLRSSLLFVFLFVLMVSSLFAEELSRRTVSQIENYDDALELLGPPDEPEIGDTLLAAVWYTSTPTTSKTKPPSTFSGLGSRYKSGERMITRSENARPAKPSGVRIVFDKETHEVMKITWF